jgi:hypothetical protein
VLTANPAKFHRAVKTIGLTGLRHDDMRKKFTSKFRHPTKILSEVTFLLFRLFQLLVQKSPAWFDASAIKKQQKQHYAHT